MNGDQLKHWRKQKGLSRAELGADYGVSEHTVAKWEQDVYPVPKAIEKLVIAEVSPKFTPSEYQHLSRLADEQGISVDDLLVQWALERIKQSPSPRPKEAGSE